MTAPEPYHSDELVTLYHGRCEFPDAVAEEAWAVTWEVAKQPRFMTVFIPQQVMAGAA